MRKSRLIVALLASSMGAACSNSSAGSLNPIVDGGSDVGDGGGVDDGNGCGPLSVQVDPPSIDFGKVIVDSTVTEELNVTNMSSCPITFNPVVVGGPSASLFSVVGANGLYATPIPPNAFVSFLVSFAPTQPSHADENAYLTVSFGSSDYVNVGLKGYGVTSGLCISTGPKLTSPPSLSFGIVPLNNSITDFLYVGNCSNEIVMLTASYLAASDGDAFSVGQCSPVATCRQVKPGDPPYALKPGDRLTYPITFAPSQDEGYLGDFRVQDDHGDTIEVPLGGGGGGPAISCQTMPSTSPLALDFGEVVVDTGATLDLVCTNTGNDITLAGKIDPSGELQINENGLTIDQSGSSFRAQLYVYGLATPEVALRAGETCVVEVTYDPSAVAPSGQNETATLNIATNALQMDPLPVLLSGQGTAAH